MKYFVIFLTIFSMYGCKKNTYFFNCSFHFDLASVLANQTNDSLYLSTNQNIGTGNGSLYTIYYSYGNNIERSLTIPSVSFDEIHRYAVSKDSLANTIANVNSLYPYRSNLTIDSLTLKDVYYLNQLACLDNNRDTAILHFKF
jgi:hypothetical protein